MLTFVYVNSLTGNSSIKLTQPDPKYIGQKFLIINTSPSPYYCGVGVPTGSFTFGAGSNLTLNGAYPAGALRVTEVIYFGPNSGGSQIYLMRPG